MLLNKHNVGSKEDVQTLYDLNFLARFKQKVDKFAMSQGKNLAVLAKQNHLFFIKQMLYKKINV